MARFIQGAQELGGRGQAESSIIVQEGQPTSHVLLAVSSLLSDTREERTQFPRVIATPHPTAPKSRSLAPVSGSPIAPESPKAKNGLAVGAASHAR